MTTYFLFDIWLQTDCSVSLTACSTVDSKAYLDETNAIMFRWKV